MDRTEKQPTMTGRRVVLGVVAACTTVAGFALLEGRISAHEGDYYPEEPDATIPEAARSIIEESTTGSSMTLIYTGIAALVAVGVAVSAANLLRSRRTQIRPAEANPGDIDGTEPQ